MLLELIKVSSCFLLVYVEKPFSTIMYWVMGMLFLIADGTYLFFLYGVAFAKDLLITFIVRLVIFPKFSVTLRRKSTTAP